MNLVPYRILVSVPRRLQPLEWIRYAPDELTAFETAHAAALGEGYTIVRFERIFEREARKRHLP